MKVTVSTVFACLCISLINAQNTSPWYDKPETEMRIVEGRKLFPLHYRTAGLDIGIMQDLLASAPDETEVRPTHSALILAIPLPEGGIDSFRLVEYAMMEPGLANKYPDIRTFRGIHLRDPFKSIRCEWTAKGFSAMILSRDGRYHVEPFARGNQEDYLIFYKRDYPAPVEPFSCGTEAEMRDLDRGNQNRVSGDCTFRTYRLAIAATGEYSNYFNADSEDEEDLVLSEVVICVNRVNGVYEKDVAVRMILIENTTEIFYYDPVTDPYTSGCGTLLQQNQTTIDNIIGSGNYDIGHLFSVGGGGCAQLSCVCSNSSKAYGQTGTNPPDGDLFYIDYVAHEMGHQFGGNHTQYNNCNRHNPTAYEPGSASTIMGYAGICDPDVQNNSDDYFHGISVQEINNFTANGGGNNCDVPISWSNSPPVLSAGADYTIPKSTPFMLTAIATDADEDPLTYCWEQWNKELGSTMPPVSTNTAGPMFRSLDPDPSPTRYFPRLQDLVNNNNPTWEVLPSVTRNMEFRITVRDFHDGMAGCTDEDNINVNSTSTAGPFIVTNPNTSSVIWHEGATETVTWNVANTTNSPVSSANVDILLSYDGGFTYPVTLLSNTPNDGNQNVTVPYGLSTTARVMVKGRNHVFFDISNQNFEIRCGLIVTSNADSGDGSLRDVLTCASAGDIITFAPALNGSTISLLTPLNLTNEITILSSPGDDITIDGSLVERTLYIDPAADISITGITIVGGTGPLGCALLIDGDLILEDVAVLTGPECSKSLVINWGSLTLVGNCQVSD